MKLDVEYKEDKINSLGREVADLENRGADQEEVRYSVFLHMLSMRQPIFIQLSPTDNGRLDLHSDFHPQYECN